jgi:hypothetical protein
VASPATPREKPGPFQCPRCPDRKPYAQRQGLVRHLREKHEPSFECSHPGGCNYEWAGSRRYEYVNHLRKKHKLEDDKIEEILAQPPKRCRDRDNVAESDQMAGRSEPEITATGHEDSSGLGHLAATHAPSALLSEEEFALLGGYHRIHGHFPFVHTALIFPSVHPRPTTAETPRNSGMQGLGWGQLEV